MRKTLTIISLGLAGWILAGCEQQDTLDGADDLGSPAGEPEVQIGQGDPFDEPEPAQPGSIEREIEPTIIQEEPSPGGLEPADEPLGGQPLEPQQDPLTPPPPPNQ